MPLTVSFKNQQWFFDRAKVADLVGGKANAYRMGRGGAFVRQRARTSIRRRKMMSSPGKPPSAHSKDAVATIKNIQFAFDARRASVVIGPVSLNYRHYLGATLRGGAIPEVLEYGGTLGIIEWLTPTHGWQRADLRTVRRRGWPVRVRQAHYQARAFMGPALQKEVAAGTILGLWNNAGKKSG